MRFKCFLLLIGLGLILGPAAGREQLRGQSEKTSGKDAPRRSATGLNARWNQLAGEATVWRRVDVTDPEQLFVFDLLAERLQCTNDEITREQFLGVTRRPAAARSEEAAPANQGGAATPKADERRAPTPNTPPPVSLPAGKDEPPARPNRLAGRKTIVEGNTQRQPPAPGASTVNQSSNLPEAFRKYDTDGDGQIGLYEWKAAGQPIALFMAKDLNGDGFLTPDELAEPVANAESKDRPKGEPEPDPGSLMAFQNQVGKLFAFTVTGSANGAVWGSDVYTADSALAMAAVHAGVLEVGKTGTVKVRIVAPPPSFTGTTANGVTTQSYGPFPGAYHIVK